MSATMPQRGNRLSAVQNICDLFRELQESDVDEAFRNTMGAALISMLEFVQTNPSYAPPSAPVIPPPSAAVIPPPPAPVILQQLPISIAMPVQIAGNVYVRDVRPLESPVVSRKRKGTAQSSGKIKTIADIEALLEKNPFRDGKVISFSPELQRCTIETFDRRVIHIDPFVKGLLYVSINESGGINLCEPESEGESDVIIESKINWPRGPYMYHRQVLSTEDAIVVATPKDQPKLLRMQKADNKHHYPPPLRGNASDYVTYIYVTSIIGVIPFLDLRAGELPKPNEMYRGIRFIRQIIPKKDIKYVYEVSKKK